MKDTFVTVSQKQIKHVEGDVWEESGKLWTIKNGIKNDKQTTQTKYC